MKRKYYRLFVMFFMVVLMQIPTYFNLCRAEEILPDGKEIWKNYIEAVCVKDTCENLRNMKREETEAFDRYGFEFQTTLYWEKSGNYLSIADMFPINKIIGGRSGEIDWTIDRDDGARILEGEELEDWGLDEDLLNFSFKRDPAHWEKWYKSVRTVGIENVNGRDCYKVVFTPHSGFKTTRWYDKENYLIIKYEWEKGTEEKFTCEDYEDHGGILLPRTIRREIKRDPPIFVTTTIDRLEINIDMPIGIFDLPEEIKALLE